MIEEDIQKLTAAITQLTVTTEALLETLRSQTVVNMTVETPEPAPAPKPKKAKAQPVVTKAEVVERIEEAKVAGQIDDGEAKFAVEKAKDTPMPDGVTLEQLRAEAQKALDAGKAKQIVAINKEFGLKRISDANADQYPLILARLEEINGQA